MFKKHLEIVFWVLDDSIWIGCDILSLLRREYLLSAVNVSTNWPKILHICKKLFFQLNFLSINQ